MADITNVQLGVVSVTYKGVDLGHTKDGAEYNYEPEYKDVTVDKYGSSPVDSRLIGEKVTVKVKLAESTIPNFAVAQPQGQFAGAANARRLFGSIAGKKASDSYGQLVLHPVNEGTRRYDLVLHKAYVHNAIVVPFKNDEERVLEVEFMAYVDESKSDGNYLGLFGDSGA